MARREAEWETPLKGWQRYAMYSLIPFTIVLMAVGTAGLLVLLDEEKQSWLAQTDFGRYWVQLTNFLPVVNAATLNGGILGLLICIYNLHMDHKCRKRLQQGESAAAAPSAPRNKAARGRAKKVD